MRAGATMLGLIIASAVITRASGPAPTAPLPPPPVPTATAPPLETPSPTPPPPPPPGTCSPSVGPGIPAPASVPAGMPGLHGAWYGQSGYPTSCAGQSSTATVAFY